MIENSTLDKAAETRLSRRRFVSIAGILAGAGLISSVTGCKKEDEPLPDLGSGDFGMLNYLYVLQQMEAAFYIQVIAKPYVGISDLERDYFTDIRNHEIAHREFFKNLLANAALAPMEFDFSTIDFRKRTDVLDASIKFEDLMVSAFSGATPHFAKLEYLTAVAKVASVESRHAAAIRDIKLSGTFAGAEVVNPINGNDIVSGPQAVLSAIAPYLKTQLNSMNLPS